MAPGGARCTRLAHRAQLKQFCVYSADRRMQPRDVDRQAESARSGTARIGQQQAVALPDQRLVGMAANGHPNMGCIQIVRQVRRIMGE